MYVLLLSVYVCGAAFNVDNNELLPTSNFRLFYTAFVLGFFFVCFLILKSLFLGLLIHKKCFCFNICP